MEIHYWADYTCPNSYIGVQNLMKALNSVKADADLFMHAFERNPDLSKEMKISAAQQLKQQEGLNRREVREKIQEMNEAAAQSGLPMDYAKAELCSTFDAHRLTAWAQSVDLKKANALTGLIFDAFFGYNQDIADQQVLAGLAEKAGFSRKEAEDILSSDAFTGEVRAAEMKAEEAEINSCPWFDLGTVKADHPKTAEEFVQILEEYLKL